MNDYLDHLSFNEAAGYYRRNHIDFEAMAPMFYELQ